LIGRYVCCACSCLLLPQWTPHLRPSPPCPGLCPVVAASVNHDDLHPVLCRPRAADCRLNALSLVLAPANHCQRKTELFMSMQAHMQHIRAPFALASPSYLSPTPLLSLTSAGMTIENVSPQIWHRLLLAPMQQRHSLASLKLDPVQADRRGQGVEGIQEPTGCKTKLAHAACPHEGPPHSFPTPSWQAHSHGQQGEQAVSGWWPHSGGRGEAAAEVRLRRL
jgi:hypothetical protein